MNTNETLSKLIKEFPDKIKQETLENSGIIKTTILEKVVVYTKELPARQLVHLIAPITTITPEELATVQAMYSRSNKSILLRFIDLLNTEEALDNTTKRIVGDVHKNYGHASIGDLGSFVMAYEGISMLAAKAIQDNQLYNGQEASTRYITFKNQPFLFVNGEKLSLSDGVKDTHEIQESWRKFYLDALPEVRKALFEKYPWEEQKSFLGNEGKEDYERAINARTFDIVRGFLPAGTSTNLAWYTSIRGCADHVSWMRCHPLCEVQDIAFATEEVVKEVYPTAFEGRGLYEERETYKKVFMQSDYYLETPSLTNSFGKFVAHIDEDLLEDSLYAIMQRPKGQEMHYSVGETGVIRYDALLDFASFRDQQRHRAVVQRHGLVNAIHGFHKWYLNQLPETLQEKAIQLIQNNVAKIDALLKARVINRFEAQYLFPMGMKIPTRIVGPLGKMLYFVELRAQTTVHPTLHENAYILAMEIQMYLAGKFQRSTEDIPLYVDAAIGQFSLKRGGQTIFFKGKAISDEE